MSLALYLQSTNVLYSTLVILLCSFIHEYNIRYIYPYYPKFAKGIETLVNMVYLAAVSVCIEEIYCGIINPILTYCISAIKYLWNGLLKASGFGQDTGNIAGSSGPSNSNPSPNPGPGDGIKSGFSGDNSKKKNKEEAIADLEIYEKNYDDFRNALTKTERYRNHSNLRYNLSKINEEYRDYLSSEGKQKLTELINKPSKKIPFDEKTTVKEFLLAKKQLHDDR
ncbi:MAG: hypothetical protein EOP34_02210 [Rickettsiales bacterium]|nr:MAG: hypothetical protein EOP34_02210 [Rickettsiales bacterium]